MDRKRDERTEYRLIALDMDGTLLDSEKKLLPSSIEALRRAHEAGKVIVLSTGRGPRELREHITELGCVDYLDCLSGALVYDVKNERILAERGLSYETVEALLDISEQEDTMVQIMHDRSHVQRDRVYDMAHYRMAQYQPMYERLCHMPEDLRAWYEAEPFSVSKFNMYHTDTEARERTVKRVAESGLKVSTAYSEETSLEVSAENVDKGTGLRILCDEIGLPIGQTIAVGDADNDAPVLRAAGLGIAMANANETILGIADAVVADNDHGGCAEAVYRYLMNEEA